MLISKKGIGGLEKGIDGLERLGISDFFFIFISRRRLVFMARKGLKGLKELGIDPLP
jgi:hypothetical protein